MQSVPSLLAIGITGVGKSTIGNVILSGKRQGIFVTSPNSSSCTTDAETRVGKCAGIEVSFTDTPGIPDANPNKTKENYDKCVNVIRETPLSAIAFVFPYGKISYHNYRQSKLMFCEIKKAACLKVLIINDKHDYSSEFAEMPDEKDYQDLAKEIAEYTEINFISCYFMNRTTMFDKLSGLMQLLSRVAPVPSPGLRNFTELQKYVERTMNDVDIYQEAKKQILADIQERERIVTFLKTAEFGVTVAGHLAVHAAVFTGQHYLLAGFLVADVMASCCRKKVHDSQMKTKEQEQEHLVAEKQIQDAAAKLKEAKMNFEALADALDADQFCNVE